jgi:predicted hotdog family 3-hydroxylacyl-ACP dehydratase
MQTSKSIESSVKGFLKIMLKFPVPVADIFEFMPHRPPMVWIDEILSVNETGGVCLVRVKDGAYMSAEGIRPTSYIEFMAQSFGYVSACQLKVYPNSRPKPTQVFLCGIRDLEINNDKKISEGEQLRIEVKRTHEMGPLILFEGKVFSSDGTTMAKGQIKLFAQ